jgi:hypothetical protein
VSWDMHVHAPKFWSDRVPVPPSWFPRAPTGSAPAGASATGSAAVGGASAPAGGASAPAGGASASAPAGGSAVKSVVASATKAVGSALATGGGQSRLYFFSLLDASHVLILLQSFVAFQPSRPPPEERQQARSERAGLPALVRPPLPRVLPRRRRELPRPAQRSEEELLLRSPSSLLELCWFRWPRKLV